MSLPAPRFLAIAAVLTLPAPLARAEAPLLASQVPQLAITALADLPAASPANADPQLCDHLFVGTPATPAGQATMAKGWAVTGEAAFGPYTAVSFIGKAEAATSGTCALTQGNVGIWSGNQMVALVFTQNPDDDLIGSVIPSGLGLRILSGSVVPGTVADLRLIGGTDIAVTPPALSEPVCGGRAEVPLVEGMPIDMARKLLVDYGWHAQPQDAPGVGMAADIAARGVTEVEDCSGTGFGFCSYLYVGPAGGLSVITAGEIWDGGLPTVTGYAMTCAS